MSEEVVIVGEVQAGVFFVLSLDSMIALLDKDTARGLRDDLNEFLGVDKQPPSTVGIEFPAGCEEPDLPIGTRLIDNEGDIIQRYDDGWGWVYLFGDSHPDSDHYSWSEVTDSRAHQWFRVVA